MGQIVLGAGAPLLGCTLSACTLLACTLAACALLACARDDEVAPEPLVVPRGATDAVALAQLASWEALPVFAEGVYRMQSSEDRQLGQPQPIALWERGNRDFNNFVCRGANTDAPSGPGWVVDLPQCPEAYLRGMVMARFEGAGSLARLWLTAASIRARPPDHEVVRIYVDDRETPFIQAPLREMLGGGGDAIFAPPFGAGSWHYLAWRYPIAFNTKLVVTLDHLSADDLYFHQTAVVLDRAPTARQTSQDTGAAQLGQPVTALADFRRLLQSRVPTSGPVRATRLTLAPGASQELVERGPATLVDVTLRTSVRTPLERLHLRVFWDAASEAAIDVSLADLFALWDAPAERASLALSARREGDDVVASLRLPMPFAHSARFTLANESTESVAMVWSRQLVDRVPPQLFGHLHAERHETRAPASDGYHPLAMSEGRGRWVGTCASLHGRGMLEAGRRGHPFHALEGDELVFIDGERILAGTGTEDYFDGAFYFEEGPRGTPFAQVWDITPRIPATPTLGRVSACRWHVLTDAIDFHSALDAKLEIGPGSADVLERFRSVAFVYRGARRAAPPSRTP